MVDRLGPWPTQPVVIRIDATEAEVGAVRSALLTANDDPAVRRVLREASLSRLVQTEPGHCDGVRTAMQQLAPTPTD